MTTDPVRVDPNAEWGKPPWEWKGNAGPTGRQKDPDSDEWCTPKWLADALGRYDLDPCSNSRSHINAALKLGREWGHDGLARPWGATVTEGTALRRIFVNPPYSDVMPWVERAIEAFDVGCEVDMLLKLDTTTRWFARLMECYPYCEVRPFKKRLKFERPGKPPLTANFPSALVSLARSGTLSGLRDHVWGPWPG